MLVSAYFLDPCSHDPRLAPDGRVSFPGEAQGLEGGVLDERRDAAGHTAVVRGHQLQAPAAVGGPFLPGAGAHPPAPALVPDVRRAARRPPVWGDGSLQARDHPVLLGPAHCPANRRLMAAAVPGGVTRQGLARLISGWGPRGRGPARRP